MKKLLTLTLFSSILISTICAQEDDQKTADDQPEAIEELVKGATGLLGPAGELINLGIEQIGKKKKEMEAQLKNLQTEIKDVKTSANGLIDGLNTYKATVKKTNNDYSEELRILSQLAQDIQFITKNIYVLEKISDKNSRITFGDTNSKSKTGDIMLIWWRTFTAKNVVNEILAGANKALKNNEIDKLNKLDANLSSRLKKSFQSLESASIALQNSSLVGKVPDLPPDNLTKTKKQELINIDNALLVTTNSTTNGVSKLQDIADEINSSLFGYLDTYQNELKSINKELSELSLSKFQ
ncbi:MAG: hypothetical protein ABJG78_14765 [Cyclobacteriaceae bacterium]